MTISKAIRIHCVECVGGSAQAVPLCQIRDCALWPFRLGCRMGAKEYRQRVQGAWKRGGEDVDEARALGLALADFLDRPQKASISRKKASQKALLAENSSLPMVGARVAGGRLI